MLIPILLNCVIFFAVEALLTEKSLIISTTGGPVKGKLNNWNGTQYYSYQGIPYAENPTGKLRFKPPVPRKPWKEVLDATEEGAVCSQLTLSYQMNNTVEDCLNVNVYVPLIRTDELLPVMVFIHGGVLQYSSGLTKNKYGPQYLLKRGIIYVTMNYRLGPFGFLSLDIEEASGNAGLKDVLLSLKWVKQNIERFGGHPENVTLCGHSAGSLIVNYLLLTNQSYGLFNQAMLHSGSAFAPRSYGKYPKNIAFILAEELGIKTDNVKQVLETLQKVDALDILKAYDNMRQKDESPLRRYAPFEPTKEIEYDGALFTEDPREIFRKSDRIPINVPLLVGITEQESLCLLDHILTHTHGIAMLHENPENLIPSDIEYPIGSHKSKDLGLLLHQRYFGAETNKNQSFNNLVEFISDIQYTYGVNYWINRYKSMKDNNKLYFYIFGFIGDLNPPRSNISGVAHGNDMLYFYVTNILKIVTQIDARTQRMMDTMQDLMSNFVRFSDPTPEGFNDKLTWTDYGKEQNYILLNENPSMQKFNATKFYPRQLFWEEIYRDYYDYVENGGEIQKKIIP